MTISITPLTGSTGGLVEGVDLNKPIDDATFNTLNQAFLKYCVLVFRGQHLKEKSQLDFARRFGDPVVTPMLKSLDGYPEIVQITNPSKGGAITENWHYDASFAEAPPKITILSAITVPSATPCTPISKPSTNSTSSSMFVMFSTSWRTSAMRAWLNPMNQPSNA